MLRSIFAAAAILVFISCNEKKSESQKAQVQGQFFNSSYNVKNFVGTYTGSFDDGIITVVLNYVHGRNVSGYNLHKGLRRNINGTLEEKDGKFAFELKEPGDNPYDGVFSFTIDTTAFKMTGKWTPLNPDKVTAKQLVLTRKAGVTGSFLDELGTWIPASGTFATDTIMEFDPQGTVKYNFYEKPGDSTSQLISIKGNYVVQKDTVIIEWQKNTYTPQQRMKLVKQTKKIKQDDYEYDEYFLNGHGWRLTQFMGG
jgi:hypothetical protein